MSIDIEIDTFDVTDPRVNKQHWMNHRVGDDKSLVLSVSPIERLIQSYLEKNNQSIDKDK